MPSRRHSADLRGRREDLGIRLRDMATGLGIGLGRLLSMEDGTASEEDKTFYRTWLSRIEGWPVGARHYRDATCERRRSVQVIREGGKARPPSHGSAGLDPLGLRGPEHRGGCACSHREATTAGRTLSAVRRVVQGADQLHSKSFGLVGHGSLVEGCQLVGKLIAHRAEYKVGVL
jgi:hypothetical protein